VTDVALDFTEKLIIKVVSKCNAFLTFTRDPFPFVK